MQLNENDLSLLIDIADCIMNIDEFTKSIEYHQFETEKMRKSAVERQFTLRRHDFTQSDDDTIII